MGIQEEYWEHVEGKTIVAIEAKPVIPDNIGRASFEMINFYVEGFCLRLGMNSDTDEITVSIEPCALPNNSIEAPKVLKVLEGKEFFWLWLAENSQGYMDTVMMSFSDPAISGSDSLGPAVPQLAFVGASAIQVLLLSEAG